MRAYAEEAFSWLYGWVSGPGQPLSPQGVATLDRLDPHDTRCPQAPAVWASCTIFLESLFPPLFLLGCVSVGALRVGLPALTPRGSLYRFNKLAVGSVVESAFRKLKHLQVLDIEGNFEFGDVSKDRGQLEEDEDDEEEEDEEDEERR